MKKTSALVLLAFPLWAAAADKVTVEEIVAGHLASIGTPEARAAVKTRLASGKAQMKFVEGGQGLLDGKAFLLGEGAKFRVAMPFNTNPHYWGEQILFDGSKATLGFSQPGERSPLGMLLNRFDAVLKEGLVGGALCPSWALLTLEARQPKLTYKGLKDGLYQVSYQMKKGQEEEVITLYFEPQTFRHVKTSYAATVSSPMVAKKNDSSRQVEAHIEVDETFSDFAAVDGLTLPHRWMIRTNLAASRTQIREWSLAFEQILHNQAIDPKTWTLDPDSGK